MIPTLILIILVLLIAVVNLGGLIAILAILSHPRIEEEEDIWSDFHATEDLSKLGEPVGDLGLAIRSSKRN